MAEPVRIEVELDAVHAKALADLARRSGTSVGQSAATSIIEHLEEHNRAFVLEAAIAHVLDLDADMRAGFADRFPA
jgi:hypothetical protein